MKGPFVLLAAVHHAHALVHAHAHGHGRGLVGRTLARAAHLYTQVYAPLTVVGLCLLGALCYAASSVLEQSEAAAAPHHTTMRLGLLSHLLRRPLWLVGNLAGLLGYGFQFLALRRGSLALVQPLLVSGLLFALIGGALNEHRRLTRREWLSTALVAAGLSLFLVVARPGPGHPRASTLGWLALGAVTAVFVGGLGLLGHRSHRVRPLSLGAAAGILLGVTAALTERTAHLLSRGLIPLLGDWPPYALLVVGAAGLLLTQLAFQAGELKWSLPALTVVEPLVAILIGQVLFGEHISTSGLAPVGEVLGLAMMVLGVLGLSQGMHAVTDRAGPMVVG
ncbi:MAG: DMT family transporter [Solirubrobacteraceae bacterium]